jgi:hypothetical protein
MPRQIMEQAGKTEVLTAKAQRHKMRPKSALILAFIGVRRRESAAA